MDYTKVAARMLLDRQYHKTVLKVPDDFGIAKGCVSKEMALSGCELFRVSKFVNIAIFLFLPYTEIRCCICLCITNNDCMYKSEVVADTVPKQRWKIMLNLPFSCSVGSSTCAMVTSCFTFFLIIFPRQKISFGTFSVIICYNI